ncbi:MAG TPA: hypothetical protein VLA28_10260, partial [Afifellaceae bacterium]|nr:hypothetical protein [Afifellaceae bacterium]
MFADRKRHGTAGPVDLGRQLNTCGRSTDNQNAADRQKVGPAIAAGYDLLDIGRQAGGKGGNVRHAASADG